MTGKSQVMKPVSVHMTQKIEARIDAMRGRSRSEKVRAIMAAILAAYRNGDNSALDTAAFNALQTDWPHRKEMTAAGADPWHKSIIWLPMNMFMALEAASGRRGVKVAGLIRGALVGATEVDVSEGVSTDGSGAWAGDVTRAQAASPQGRA